MAEDDDYNSRQRAASSSELTGDELQQLQDFGYKDFDRERHVLILGEEGIRQWLSVINKLKRRVATLDKIVQTSIPMKLLADRAKSAFRRNPKREESNFQRTEDMLATWSEAHNGAGSDVLEDMNDCYEQTMDKMRKDEERRWLMENGGKNIHVSGNYRDESTTKEWHDHKE